MTLQDKGLLLRGKSTPQSNGSSRFSGIYPDAERVGMRGTAGTGLKPAPALALEYRAQYQALLKRAVA
jgi:hypothetical protein